MSAANGGGAIRLRGVRHNNLKNFDLDLPLGRLIVITGLSGSGKSSLAFDTLFAEGQRRYIETFSPYARQFFDRMDKPRVDSIEGIPPAIAIEQRNAVRTTRSTVGTMTEICDYMKVVWPHLAKLHCKQCGKPVEKESPQRVWEKLNSEFGIQDLEFLVTFDLPLTEKLSLKDSLQLVAKQGYQRLLIEGEAIRLEDAPAKFTGHGTRSALTIIQDRLKLAPRSRARFIEACEQAYHFGKGRLAVHLPGSRTGHDSQFTIHDSLQFSNRLHCATCNLDYREPSSALFSFNHPTGACPACKGFGRVISIDYDLAVPDRSRTLAEGVVKPWLTATGVECQDDLMKFCKKRGVPVNVPFHELPREAQDWVMNGDPGYDSNDPAHRWPKLWYGVKGYFRWLESKSYKMHVRVLLSRYRAYTKCPACDGKRFQPEALLYRIWNSEFGIRNDSIASEVSSGSALRSALTLADFYALPIRDALQLIVQLADSAQSAIANRQSAMAVALDEVRARLGFLAEVGLGYLTLDRPTRTLSGGETERVNLTTCLGTRLVNTLFVLDEPSVGLHPRDTARLVRILERLRDAGNTVVVVEHEAAVMRAADQIVDLGPASGERGGEVVFQGTFAEVLHSDRSLTGAYLSGRKAIAIPARRVAANVSTLTPARSLRENSRQRVHKFESAKSQETVSKIPPLPAGEGRGEGESFHQTSTLSPSQAAPRLRLSGATQHNLRNVTVEIPLGRFVVVTGVSGSGKSTLIRDILYPTLEAKLRGEIEAKPAAQRLGSEDNADRDDSEQSPIANRQSATLDGWQSLNRAVLVDQSALGKTPRSNPAVYIGAFDDIREFFAQSEAAKQRGLNASAFSFNSAQGQCERCRGAGFEKVEMQFLSDVFIRCPDCDARRYRAHILDVKVESQPSPLAPRPSPVSMSIADLLDATVDDVIAFLSAFAESRPAQRAAEKLRLLQEVGLGYLRLGQPINTLSGGESQRLKLVSHLAEASREPDTSAHAQCSTLFLFDEPTTGLHFDDVRVLLGVFQRLVNAGHSVLVIEHNLDVIKSADWLIDLGPDAGDEGGRIVAEGTPEDVAKCKASHTGRFLRSVLGESVKDDSCSVVRKEASPLPVMHHSPRATLSIHGAREHNLKNLSVDIPRGKFVVVTGVSGSGKSTLAFDLLFAEGQRRFLDAMSAYAWQFVEQMARPDVDCITGIPPTVSIEQRNSRGGGKSTVATVTEVHHFLRLLFARLGTQFCPDCNVPVEAQTRDEVGRRLQIELKRRGDLLLLAPVVKNRKGFHSDVAAWAAKHGYKELRADGKMFDTSKPFRLDRFKEHDVEVVVGALDRRGPEARRNQKSKTSRLRVSAVGTQQQLVDETLSLGHGTLLALDNHGVVTVHSTERACPSCGRSFEPLDPKNFSYNSSQGWCPKCRGFGELFWMPEDVDRGERADAIEETWFNWQEGEREICPECNGARLNPVARAVRLNAGADVRRLASIQKAKLSGRNKIMEPPHAGSHGVTMDALAQASVANAFEIFHKIKFAGRAAQIAQDILPEIHERLKFLNEVGLGYLQLGRGVTTLSGGESQRIRLAAQLGSNLSGVLYVLDEPTIGLHARDNEQLLAALEKLKSRGNSLVVVEHDEETMRRADWILDLGPGAGVRGGQVVASGTLNELMRHADSVTGQCLRAEKKFPSRGERRAVVASFSLRENVKPPVRRLKPATTDVLTLRGASEHNLKKLTVRIPLNRFVVVTGVSGSGKSTLVRECLLPVLRSKFKVQGSRFKVSKLAGEVSGHEHFSAVYEVDQSPIGRTPRSTPATYVGFFDDIRALFAQVPEARLRGYGPGRFSFNSAQGRCPGCDGAGEVKLEMNFLPPAWVRCEACGGVRFNRETLDIEFGGRNIAQVLDLSVAEALEFFAAFPRIRRPLEALRDTGLDYLKLGQTSPTLSGGEAQRVKLVTHLLGGLKAGPDAVRSSKFKVQSSKLFVLEEPTIGLHMADVRRLVEVLQRLVDSGHTVLVIEHNLDLIAEADWVIDLGPEGGAAGGELVAEGTPEIIARKKRSHTGRFLRGVLGRR